MNPEDIKDPLNEDELEGDLRDRQWLVKGREDGPAQTDVINSIHISNVNWNVMELLS